MTQYNQRIPPQSLSTNNKDSTIRVLIYYYYYYILNTPSNARHMQYIIAFEGNYMKN
jgi:hypothetical protein